MPWHKMFMCRRKALFKRIGMSGKFEKIGSSNCMSFSMHYNNIARIMTDGKYELVTVK